MRTRQERLSYILEKAENFEKSLLEKIPMMILKNGLYNTLKYLGTGDEVIEGEEEKKKDSEEKKIRIYNYLCEYIVREYPGMIEEEKIKHTKENRKMLYTLNLLKTNQLQSNLNYMYLHKELLQLANETVLLCKRNEKEKKFEVKDEFNVKPTNISKKEIREGISNIYLLLTKGYYKKEEKRKDITKNNSEKSKEQKRQKEEKEEEIIKKGLEKEEKNIENLLKKKKRVADFYDNLGYTEHKSKLENIDGFRTIIGLGDTSPREVSIHLNFLYGIPEIPSTAIKGVFSHYCMEQGVAKERLEQWFGSQEQQGNIIFTTAYPEDYEIKEDVITNHFKNYYKEKSEVEYPNPEEPIIISFYSIFFKKIEICFYLKPVLETEKGKIETLWNNCLENCNFGAKGAVGYGYFRKIKQENIRN